MNSLRRRSNSTILFLTLSFSIFLCSFESYSCMNNGLALKPPMGWMSWLKYACNVDCQNFPDECISEKLYKDMIDRIAEDGWLELGYDTVNIDDCWSEMERDPLTKQLIPDRRRFPNGIRALAEYANRKGVKLGIYSDVGNATCGGYPSARDDDGHDFTDIDAITFNSWNVSSLKLDGCNQETNLFPYTYPAYSRALEKFGPQIVYACSWPAYLDVKNMKTLDYIRIRENCNYWRNFNDIMDSWESVLSIIDFYGKYGSTFAKYHGPGGWFDADMLIIGNDGLSYEQSKTQMAFWSLWSVPLLMSNDLRKLRPEMRDILMNKRLIAINQDPLGSMGRRLSRYSTGKHEVWVKELLTPFGDSQEYCYCILYFNRAVIGVPKIMSYRLIDMIPDLDLDKTYLAFDVFQNNTLPIGKYDPMSNLTLRVPTSGSVRMILLSPFDTVNYI